MAINPPTKKPPAKVVKQAVATVAKQSPDGSEDQAQEVLGELAVDPMNHCMVEFSVGITRNMGDYNSMKFTVGITLPSETTEEDLDATFDSAKQWIDAKVNALNAEIDASMGG